MGGDSCDSLHEPVCEHESGVHWEGSHHTDKVALVECTDSVGGILFLEAVQHRSVLEISELVRLHQSLDVVEWVIENPVENTSNTSSQKRHVHGQIFFVRNSFRSGDLIDHFADCEKKS